LHFILEFTIPEMPGTKIILTHVLHSSLIGIEHACPGENAMNEYFKISSLSRIIFMIRTLLHYHLSFKYKFASIKSAPAVWGIWNVEVHGPNIHIGKNVVIIGGHGSRTRINTVDIGGFKGKIEIGDNVLVMNGVRISSASSIIIGDDCMLANYCYLTDADWHDIHDRTSFGPTKPIVLERGAWVGDSAIICKGVRIGENSIVGAGAVVRKDVPANVIVVGNPARIVKKLDPKKVKTLGPFYERFGGPRY